MKKKESKTNKINFRIILYSLIALGFLALSFLVDWIFIIGAVIMIYLNQKELFGKGG